MTDWQRKVALVLFGISAAGFAFAGYLYYGPVGGLIAGGLGGLAGMERLGLLPWGRSRDHGPTGDDHQ